MRFVIHFRGNRNVAPFILIMNIPKYRWAYLLGFITVIVFGYYLYSNRNNQNEILVNKYPVVESVHIDKSVIYEWTTYAHHSLGYRIDYPQNYLPVISFGTTTSSVLTFFSSDPATGSGGIVVSLSKAEGGTVLEYNKKHLLDSEYSRIYPPTLSLEKVSISDPKIEAYFVTKSTQDYTSQSLQFSLDEVYYEISFIHLPQSIIDRVIKSFRIDFAPKNL